MTNMRTVLVLIMYFFSVCTFGQTRIITFEEAVEIALKNGVQLNLQKSNLENAQVQKMATWLGFGPTLSASTSYNQINGNFFNQNEGKVVNGLFNQASGSINAAINIFNGFSQVNRVKQFNNQLDAQMYFVDRTRQDLLNAVATQYLQVLLDKELLRIATENWEVLKKQAEQVTEQVKLGSRSPVDEYNQDSQAKGAEIRVLQAEINLVNNKSMLSQTLLLDPLDEYDVVKPTWDINTIAEADGDLQAVFQTALQRRGDYLRAQKNEVASKYAFKASKGNLMPSLVAFWNINTFYNKLDGDNTAAAFDQQVRTDNLRKVYGVQLNIPILGGTGIFQNRANVVQQRTTYYNNQILRRNVEVQVKADVLRAHQNFKLVKRTYYLSQAQLNAAESAFSLETERYNLGVTNFVDFINANRVFVQAQTDKAQAEYRLLFQKVLLDYAVGTLKIEDIQP